MTKAVSRYDVRRTILYMNGAGFRILRMSVKDHLDVLFVRANGYSSAKWAQVKAIDVRLHQGKRLLERNLRLISPAHQP